MSVDQPGPSVAIVIPVRNEVAAIADALDSCLDQSYMGSITVVVADANSNDGTRDVVQRYSDSHDVKLIDNAGLVTPYGLNRAIEASQSDIIVRCDARSILPQDYVEIAVRIVAETGAGNVGGIQRAVGDGPVQRGIAAAMTNPLGVGDAKFHRGGRAGPVDTVYLGVFPRAVIDHVGGYDESLIRNQDYELNVRIRDAGYTVWFDPALEVEYSPRRSLNALWRQYHDYGRWKRRVVLKHPSSLKARQVGPPVLVAGLALSALTLATPLRRIGAAALIGYATAVSVAGVYEAARRRDPAALIAGPAIAVMHIAWGVGFLAGGPRGS